MVESEPRLVSKFEKILKEIKSTSITPDVTEKMEQEKIEKAKQILKELGYDK